jgi:hypothetical protein
MSLEGVASLSQRRENCSNYKPELVAALRKSAPTTILKGKHRGLREQRQAEQTKAISTDVRGRIFSWPKAVAEEIKLDVFKQSIGGEWYIGHQCTKYRACAAFLIFRAHRREPCRPFVDRRRPQITSNQSRPLWMAPKHRAFAAKRRESDENVLCKGQSSTAASRLANMTK